MFLQEYGAGRDPKLKWTNRVICATLHKLNPFTHRMKCMTEVIVFLIVGSIAILSAAFMLVSKNAVHSAVFLVLNFMCVAFFFLTLSAPFIALVQVAVYAGAIMVLFLFVIMLLGAERVVGGASNIYNWLPRAALVLVTIFLITVGWALASGEINTHTPPPAAPQVRVIHAAEAPPVDVYLNNQIFVEGVNFREATDYHSLAAGTYGVTVFPAGADPATESAAILGELVLSNGDVVTMVAVGANGVFQLVRLEDNPLPPGPNQARLTILNALPDVPAIDLVDPGLPSADDTTVLIASAGFAEPVETLLVDAAEARTLAVQQTGSAGDRPLATYRDLPLMEGTNNLLIAAPEQLPSGTRRIAPVHVAQAAQPLFGSPDMVAQALYTDYLLPFEMVSVLLLAAMIGAVVLARHDLVQESRPRRPVVLRPLIGAPTATLTTPTQEPTRPVTTPKSGD